MGLFGDQSLRLLRDNWSGEAGTRELAEELYAMFESTSPMKLTGPVTIENNTTDPGLTIKQLGGSDDSIRIIFPPIDPVVFPPLPPLPDFPPNETITNIDNTGGGGSGGGTGGSTNVFLGRVVSGSGATYVVDLFGNGSGQAATLQVTATVPQIDPTATIPVNTWIGAVHRFSNGTPAVITWEFQPPTWL